MNNLSLYLHYPFCKKKCNYCDFYSLPDLSGKRRYEKALAESLSCFKEARGREVSTVYFGGGTPSLFSKEGLDEIFSAIRENFSLLPGAEITVEMNPESASEEILSAFAEKGVNRISFGVQSSSEKELSALGRLHNFSDAKLAVERARRAGIDNISLDLMYGLPEQTFFSFQKSLEDVLSLSPKHISFYLLTLSTDVPLYQKRHLLPDEETVRKMYLYASAFLQENGFEHYEISNAAKPGFRSRHNETYWTGGEYLGFGPGAHSYFNSKRFFVKDGVEEFILASNPADRLSEMEMIGKEDLLTEYLMLSLRRKEGISLDVLSQLAGKEFCDKVVKKMSLWSDHGLCEKTERGYGLTAEGFFVSNEIITELI